MLALCFFAHISFEQNKNLSTTLIWHHACDFHNFLCEKQKKTSQKLSQSAKVIMGLHNAMMPHNHRWRRDSLSSSTKFVYSHVCGGVLVATFCRRASSSNLTMGGPVLMAASFPTPFSDMPSLLGNDNQWCLHSTIQQHDYCIS